VRKSKYTFIKTRSLIRCKKCRYEESFISNTIMRKTRKALPYWFWAIYTIATQKTGLSAMELYRQLHFGSYQTAWTWLHKIRMAMVNPKRIQLRGEVEVDETYIYKGQKKGRSLLGRKILVVCAVESRVTMEGRIASGRVQLRAIPSASAPHLHSFIIDHIEKGSTIRTDGWHGYEGISQYGFTHIPETLERPEEASKKFPGVHRVFANLQAWLLGTHRYVSKKHLQNYLNEYAFRFNTRYNPMEAFNYVLQIAVLTQARPYKEFTKVKRPYYINPNKMAPLMGN